MILTAGILLAVTGIGMIGFWAQHIARGGLPEGVKTTESGGYIIFHVIIELVTGSLCVIGGMALIFGIYWRLPAALIAAGMLFYACVNSLAWKEVRHRPVLSLMFIISAAIAIYTAVCSILFIK